MDAVRRRGLRGAGLRASPGGRCGRACRSSKARRARPLWAPKPAIERDARGIPVITAATRADLAYATGYAHAQDRFFQMDLSRRLAGGRTLGTVRRRGAEDGPAHAPLRLSRGRAARDRSARREAERAVIEAYARGVNAGLASLRAPALGIPAAARAAREPGCPRIPCWWCTRCGGSCSTARLRDELDRRRLERAAAKGSDARGRARAHHLRLRRPLGLGYA